MTQVLDLERSSEATFFLQADKPALYEIRSTGLLATSGTLRTPGVLAAEVRRMIRDGRADALVSNFTGQWLSVRSLRTVWQKRRSAAAYFRLADPTGAAQHHGKGTSCQPTLVLRPA